MKKTFLISILIFAVLSIQAQSKEEEKEYEKQTNKKFEETISLIENHYFDSVNMPDLVAEAIMAMTKKMDPHSSYLSKSKLKYSQDRIHGRFVGIGITYQYYNDSLYVLKTIENGPSDLAGIKAGFIITKVEEKSIVGKFSTQKISTILRGEKKSNVKLTCITYPGHKETVFEVTRDQIPVSSINAHYMISPKIGFISIRSFSTITHREFVTYLEELQTEGMQDLILDLRGNPGGVLTASVNIANEFLENKKTIVYTQGAQYKRKYYESSKKGKFKTGKLILLVNEHSASASEILSGSMQDLDRALIVGRRSYGKGLVQRSYYLPDRSAIKLTVARYYTASGRCIQKPWTNGIEEYRKDLNNRYKHQEYIHPDSINFPDSLKYQTANGRTIFGGGGIMPDVFIPLDTTYYSGVFNKINNKNYFNSFCMQYLIKNRNSLDTAFVDFADYNKNLNQDKLFKEFCSYLKEKEFDISRREEKRYKAKIKHHLFATLASKYYGNNEYIIIMNNMDKTVIRSVEIMQNSSIFDQLKIQY